MKNEPAFPSTSCDGTDQVMGMTLRDYFAAKAMRELIWDSEEYLSKAAELAYKIADAMLAEREKTDGR